MEFFRKNKSVVSDRVFIHLPNGSFIRHDLIFSIRVSDKCIGHTYLLGYLSSSDEDKGDGTVEIPPRVNITYVNPLNGQNAYEHIDCETLEHCYKMAEEIVKKLEELLNG